MKYGTLIGIGNTADVYEWENSRVIKLFHEGYPKEAIEKEFHNAVAIRDMNFSKPNAYEITSCENKTGIIYDKAEGESLIAWVMKTHDVQKCAKYMAELHKAILQNKISDVPNYKEFLKYNIHNDLKQQMIDKLPDGDTLCHGDFHPGNIIINNGHTMVIDFMNICRGDYLYDVARTAFLVQYTPVPEGTDNKEMLIQFKKTLTDLYLKEMNVKREMIQDYLSIITAARFGECADE